MIVMSASDGGGGASMKTNFPKEKASQNTGGVIKWDPLFFVGVMVIMMTIDNHLKRYGSRLRC